MRRTFAISTLALALGVAGVAAAATVTVRITKSGFSPANVTVRSGDTVTWRNADTVNHQLVANNGSFASPVLRPGATYSHVFRQAGRFPYHDALKPTLKGTVVVTGPPPSVSLGASLPIVRFGTQISLAGAISSGQAGRNVSIWAQPYGQPSFVQVAVVQTTTGGAFGYITTPQIATAYKAQWGSTASGTIGVQVSPRITLSPPRHGYFYTRVHAAVSFAGRRVYVQRLSRFGQWVTIRRLQLGPRSGRIFRLRLPVGLSRVRVVITAPDVVPGYLPGASGTQPVRVTRSR